MIKNVRGGVIVREEVNDYFFTFHFRDLVWQDRFYANLIQSIFKHGTRHIVDSGVEVFHITCNVNVSPKTIIDEIVIPEFYFYGEQGTWDMVCLNSKGEAVV